MGREDLLDAAERWIAVSEENGAQDDVLTQVVLRAAKARLLARRGELTDAERLAREALGLALATEYGLLHTEAYNALSEVLETAGRFGEAGEVIRTSLVEHDRRHDVVRAKRGRQRLASLAR